MDSVSEPQRLCNWCDKPLGSVHRSDRIYCSDACQKRAERATKGRPNGADGTVTKAEFFAKALGTGAETTAAADQGPEGTVASVAFLITGAMKAKLRARGYSDEQIKEMTLAEADQLLTEPATFEPTSDWQDVRPTRSCPPGCQGRRDDAPAASSGSARAARCPICGDYGQAPSHDGATIAAEHQQLEQGRMTTRRSQLHATDRAYIEGHRWMYGELGERAATAAIMARDKLMLPGFVLPRIRLAPVAPYGHCMALCVSGDGTHYQHGVWVFLHVAYHGSGDEQRDSIDVSTVHELLHEELHQFDRYAKHNGEPWAERCQEMSNRLGFTIRIERPRSRRIDGKVTTATPEGCLPYDDLARWPRSLLRNGGPSIRERMERL